MHVSQVLIVELQVNGRSIDIWRFGKTSLLRRKTQAGFTKHSTDQICRASRDLWTDTHWVSSKSTVDRFTHFLLAKYRPQDSHVELLRFAKSFPEST